MIDFNPTKKETLEIDATNAEVQESEEIKKMNRDILATHTSPKFRPLAISDIFTCDNADIVLVLNRVFTDHAKTWSMREIYQKLGLGERALISAVYALMDEGLMKATSDNNTAFDLCMDHPLIPELRKHYGVSN